MKIALTNSDKKALLYALKYGVIDTEAIPNIAQKIKCGDSDFVFPRLTEEDIRDVAKINGYEIMGDIVELKNHGNENSD